MTITGATVQSRPTRAVFLLRDGIVLTVAYIENLLPSDTSPAPIDPPDDELFRSSGSDPAGSSGPASGQSHRSTRTTTHDAGRPRSRSPRTTGGSHSASVRIVPYEPRQADPTFVTRQSLADMWRTVFPHDALLEGMRFLTPVLRGLRFADTYVTCPSPGSLLGSPAAMSSFFPCQPVTLSRPLTAAQQHCIGLLCSAMQAICRDLDTSHVQLLYASVRHLPLAVDCQGPTGMQLEALTCDSVELPIQDTPAVFAIMTPGYTFECIELDIHEGQTVPSLLEAVDPVRDPGRRSLFPVLLPVNPQADARWGSLRGRSTLLLSALTCMPWKGVSLQPGSHHSLTDIGSSGSQTRRHLTTRCC